jgi:hypothetical protein
VRLYAMALDEMARRAGARIDGYPVEIVDVQIESALDGSGNIVITATARAKIRGVTVDVKVGP